MSDRDTVLVKEITRHFPIESMRPSLRGWMVSSRDGENMRVDVVGHEDIDLKEQTVTLRMMVLEGSCADFVDLEHGFVGAER